MSVASKYAFAQGVIVMFLAASCQNTKFVATETLPEEDTEIDDTPSEIPPETDIEEESDTDGDEDSSEETEDDTGDETDSETASETETETATETESGRPSESDTPIGSDTSGETETDSECGIPHSFQWIASPVLISPPEGTIAVKDPTVVRYGEDWLVYATTRSDDWSMTSLLFSDWDEADDVPKIPVSVNPDLAGLKAAPQLFYFTDKDKWYLVYQTQPPAYSTTENPADVESWSPMTLFMDPPPDIEDSDTGGLDYWVICDDDDCFLFFSATNGKLYRARTSKSEFPSGFTWADTMVALEEEEEPLLLHDSSNVYKIAGTDQYLLLVSAIGDVGRYFRSWTSERLDGTWVPLAATEDHAFASTENVSGADWFLDGINHGEMLRENPDETMTIDTCDMRYLFQGLTRRGAGYDANEYSLGMLTDARN